MTTIACDSKTMAADGLITSNDAILQEDSVKIFELKDGSVIGFAGNTYNWDPLLSYFNSPVKSGIKWPEVSGNFAIIHLQTDGKCFTYDEKGRKFQRSTPTAIGSGRDFALGAFAVGATPKQAVIAAMQLDTHSGGQCRVINIDETKKYE